MDRHEAVVGELQDDHFEQVPGTVGTDGENLRRVAVGVEVDHHKWMTRRIRDVFVRDAVPPRRVVNFHTRLM